MALTTSEIQSLRAHLGYGNIGLDAGPYTPDGFFEVFRDIIAPNLETGAETTSSTAVTAAGSATIVVLSATDIVSRARLVIDVGDDEETVTVRSVSGTSVSATFLKAHASTPYPVAVESGTTRLRKLLRSADAAQDKLVSLNAMSVANLKRAEDIEWYPEGDSGGVVAGQLRAYRQIAFQISDLVRVLPRWANDSCSAQLETY